MKSSRILVFCGFALSLAAAAALGLFYGRSTVPAPPAAPAAVARDDHDSKAGGDAHGDKKETAEVSDLDRPVEELFAGKCEHNVAHYS